MFYSASQNAWFDPAFRADYEKHGTWPDDAKQYPRAIYEAVSANRPNDKIMAPDQNGNPTLIDREETRQELMARAWGGIKAKRDAIKAGGVKIGAKWYHTDADSRIQHLGLKDQARDLLAAGQPDTTRLQKLGQDVRWKTMDGSFIYLTVKHAFDIVAAVGDLDALAFAAAETHRVAMEASADPAAYDFSADWPTTYADELAQQGG